MPHDEEQTLSQLDEAFAKQFQELQSGLAALTTLHATLKQHHLAMTLELERESNRKPDLQR